MAIASTFVCAQMRAGNILYTPIVNNHFHHRYATQQRLCTGAFA
jgi:hypothetical protein